MDIADFSEDDFDVKEWINKSFRSQEAQENRDAFMSNRVMKLQLYIQKMNSALEDTSQQVLQSLPRVVRDLESLQQEALLLKDKMHSVRTEIAKVEQDTAQSMETLVQIDSIKERMQGTSQAMREADNWTTLSSDVEEVFESGDIEAIAAKLVRMQQSLQILTHVPDYEDRQMHLEGLTNRLEALASPHLVAAFNSQSLEKAQKHVKIFSDVGRYAQLLKYYHKCQKGMLLQNWQSLVETEQDSGVGEWISKYYSTLTTNWHEQVRWCSHVFTASSTVSILTELYTDVLSSLDPSLEFCIEAALKQQTAPLQYLISLKQSTKKFAKLIEVALNTREPGMKIDSELLPLAKAIYAPFKPFIVKYENFEAALLLSQLSSSNLIKEDLFDTLQELSQSVPQVVSQLNDANNRCCQFSEGCAYLGLVRALKDYFSQYVEQYKIILKQLGQQKIAAEDWTMFQHCLSLIQTTGDLLLQVEQLDITLMSSFLDSTRRGLTTEQGETNPFDQFHLLLLTSDGLQQLQAFHTRVQQGKEDLVILSEVHQMVSKLCKDVHKEAFEVMFAPISSQLCHVSEMEVWSSRTQAGVVATDLPTFSYAPQEYITQIGQYLMMLPQHLDPFVLQDNPGLSRALRESNLPYSSERGESEGSTADFLLGCLARAACYAYLDTILRIQEITAGAVKQLITDIDYIGNVLDDLGLQLPDHLQSVNKLLKIPAEEYQVSSAGHPPRLVAAVRQMRSITPKVPS